MVPDMTAQLLEGPARQNMRAAVYLLDGLRMTPVLPVCVCVCVCVCFVFVCVYTHTHDGLRMTTRMAAQLQWASQNRGPKASQILASLLMVERAITPGNRDYAGRVALHSAAINPSPEAGELTRRLVKVGPGTQLLALHCRGSDPARRMPFCR